MICLLTEAEAAMEANSVYIFTNSSSKFLSEIIDIYEDSAKLFNFLPVKHLIGIIKTAEILAKILYPQKITNTFNNRQ